LLLNRPFFNRWLDHLREEPAQLPDRRRGTNKSYAMEEFHGVHHSTLIALDGTGYHCSAKIHGPCCSHRRPEKGPRIYFHTALTPVVVAPG